jgi:glycosyltransferase involved in cell wall biosynthesis
MANITIITLVFAPDGVSTATLITELAESLSQRGHKVSVLTTVPHFNEDADARQKQPLERKFGGLFHRSRYGDIDVWHTAIIRRAQGATRRMLGYMVFHVISYFIGIFSLPRQDVVIVISPPLTSGLVGRWIADVKGAKLIYNIQELYPDTFVRVGTLDEDARITRILYRIEDYVYRVSDALTTIGKVFQNAIESKGIPPQKVHVIPNFVDIDRLKPGSKDNPFARELNVVDDFVVLYAGNIGMTQSFDTLISVAERLQNEKAMKFLIVGDGVRRDDIARMIREKNLQNVILQSYQPFNRVPDIYATGDVGLVPLMSGTARVTLPSKLYTIMATGTPVIAAVDMDSDIVITVQEADSGLCVEPDDADALEQGIRMAFDQRETLKQYGDNGRQYVVDNYSRDAVVSQYEQLIEDLTGVSS